MNVFLKDYLSIIIGTVLFSLGITWFAEPIGLVAGGVTGIAIVVKNLTADKVPLFITNLVLNIPLFIICIRQRGFKFVKKSLFGLFWLSLMLALNKYIPNPMDIAEDILLSALLLGIFSGVGLGFILRASATSGGTDMLAAIIKFKKPHFPISTLILVIDGIIIALGMFIFGAYTGFYAILSLFVTTKILDGILEGIHFAKAAYILSDKYEEISDKIFNTLKRGNTAIRAKGMFTKKDKKILYVIVEPKEIIILQNIVKDIDPSAFMTITDVRRVVGEGFRDFKEIENSL